jgi:hypothetical protein
MVTVVLTVFSVASKRMYYSIKSSVRIRPICGKSAWIRDINRDQSGSIARYRLQAEVFGGRFDGKFGVTSEEISLIQVLISAGDN